jgi:hypothetical protein
VGWDMAAYSRTVAPSLLKPRGEYPAANIGIVGGASSAQCLLCALCFIWMAPVINQPKPSGWSWPRQSSLLASHDCASHEAAGAGAVV